MKDRLGCEDIPDDRLLERLLAGELSQVEREELERHYLACSTCQDDLRLALELQYTLPRLSELGEPSPNRELAETGGDVGSLRRRRLLQRAVVLRGSRLPAVVALAAAATLAGLLLLRPSITDDESTAVHRDEVTPAAAQPIAISPVGRVEAVGEFRWAPVPAADLYRITVYDGSGETLWETETEMTHLTVPPTLELKPESRYFWTVAARASWGRWVSSDMVEFRRQ